jgi:cell division protein ZapB
MQEQSILDRLSNRVTQVIQKHQQLEQESEVLRNEMAKKEQIIENLQEELAMKDLEIEEIVAKIETILG